MRRSCGQVDMLYVNIFVIHTHTHIMCVGLVDKCRDVLYVNMFAMAGSLLSDHFWWFLILIPLYGPSSFLSLALSLSVFPGGLAVPLSVSLSLSRSRSLALSLALSRARSLARALSRARSLSRAHSLSCVYMFV